jgi:hypothetical protein
MERRTPAVSVASGSAAVSEDEFVALSVELTGFSEVELLGTGVAPVYLEWLLARFPSVLSLLLEGWRRVVEDYPPDRREDGVRRGLLADTRLGPFARAIILLWYTATWYPPEDDWSAVYGGRPDDTDPIAIGAAYPEALVWKAAGAHPTATKPTGFGSWSLPPEAA